MKESLLIIATIIYITGTIPAAIRSLYLGCERYLNGGRKMTTLELILSSLMSWGYFLYVKQYFKNK